MSQTFAKNLICLGIAGLYVLGQAHLAHIFRDMYGWWLVHLSMPMVVGFFVGWFLGKIGLLLGTYLFLLIGFLGLLRIQPFWSRDIGWLPILVIYGVPTFILISVGVASSIWLKKRWDILRRGDR